MNSCFINFRYYGSALTAALLCCCAVALAQPALDDSRPSAAPSEVAPRLTLGGQDEVRLLAPSRSGGDQGTQANQARLRMADFDTKNLEAEDRLREDVPGLPLRIGVNRKLPGAPTSCATAGQWSVLPDGTCLWTFDLEVPGAVAVKVHFSRLDLPAGGRLLLCGTGQKQADVYTDRGPTGKGDFWTASVPGEVVHLQYQEYQAGSTAASPIIEVDQISHIYRDLSAAAPSTVPADGGYERMSMLPCEQDVNCYTVDPAARGAVGLMEFVKGGGTSLCSGALLADNDPNTYAGYFLTANHCLNTQTEVNSLTIYWFYQTDYCDGTFPPLATLPKSIGGTLLATSTTTDFTFIRMVDDPHDGQGFAAWTTTDPSGTVAGIHHPLGTYKRISFGTLTTDPPICGGYPTQNYWYLDWTTGAVENGSSGSPLFNSNWQVVGQLYGSCGEPPDCTNPQTSNTIYGKFGVTYNLTETYPPISSWLNQVTSDDSYEDNDTLDHAAPITRGSYALRLVDFEDYFLISSPRGGQVTVSATYSSSDFQPLLQLLCLDGTLIAQSRTWSGTETVSSNLPAGNYIIRLLKEHKWGGNYTLNVTLPLGYSDFDRDGDVDMVDFGHLQRCYSGSDIQQDPTCFDACLDGDNRVNAADMALFSACYSGPNVPAQAGCTP